MIVFQRNYYSEEGENQGQINDLENSSQQHSLKNLRGSGFGGHYCRFHCSITYTMMILNNKGKT